MLKKLASKLCCLSWNNIEPDGILFKNRMIRLIPNLGINFISLCFINSFIFTRILQVVSYQAEMRLIFVNQSFYCILKINMNLFMAHTLSHLLWIIKKWFIWSILILFKAIFSVYLDGWEWMCVQVSQDKTSSTCKRA